MLGGGTVTCPSDSGMSRIRLYRIPFISVIYRGYSICICGLYRVYRIRLQLCGHEVCCQGTCSEKTAPERLKAKSRLDEKSNDAKFP